MTLYELVKHLRQSVLDDVGGTGVDWAAIVEGTSDVDQLRWSNEELTRFINEAEKQACRSAFLLKSASTDFDISVVSGTSEYALDSRIIRIKGAYLNSTGLELVPLEYEDVMSIPNWRTTTGTPTGYILDIESQTITLYPQPIADDTVSLLVYRLPLADMSWSLAVTDTPDIRLEHQLDMLFYAAYLAYQKDEANTFDPNRADYYRQLFEKQFSTTSAYGDTRRARTSNRPIRYRGL